MDRYAKIKELLLKGSTLEEVGKEFNISRERVRQLRNKYLPELNKKNSGRNIKTINKLNIKLEDLRDRCNRDNYFNATDLQLAQSRAFTRKKQNVKKRKWEFSINMRDIEWPTHCEVLGIELDWFAEKVQENSPSFDRINPALGYIKGNVKIISWRANRIKNDGTAEEHRKIAEYIEKYD